MRKLIAILLALVMVLAIAAPAFAAEEKSKDIVILHTNDVHTYIDGDISYDTIAGVKAYLQTQYENVLLVDAGDHAQGTAYGSMDKGKTIIDLMNAAGYDLATLGNHEFAYGQDGRINVTDTWAKYPYVSCNFYKEADGVRGDNVLDAYKIRLDPNYVPKQSVGHGAYPQHIQHQQKYYGGNNRQPYPEPGFRELGTGSGDYPEFLGGSDEILPLGM